MTVTLGFDVEEFDFPLERGRGIDFGTQLAVSSEGLEFLLDLLARLELRATFYTTANFALHRTDLVRRIVAGGQEEGLTIYPVSVSAPFRVPLFWISLHVMPLPLYKLLCRSALRRDGHLNLYFHPWEFSARLREPAFGVPGYLTHCSGTDLQRKFIRLLEWLKARGCRFLTTREYLGCDE